MQPRVDEKQILTKLYHVSGEMSLFNSIKHTAGFYCQTRLVKIGHDETDDAYKVKLSAFLVNLHRDVFTRFFRQLKFLPGKPKVDLLKRIVKEVTRLIMEKRPMSVKHGVFRQLVAHARNEVLKPLLMKRKQHWASGRLKVYRSILKHRVSR